MIVVGDSDRVMNLVIGEVDSDSDNEGRGFSYFVKKLFLFIIEKL